MALCVLLLLATSVSRGALSYRLSAVVLRHIGSLSVSEQSSVPKAKHNGFKMPGERKVAYSHQSRHKSTRGIARTYSTLAGQRSWCGEIVNYRRTSPAHRPNSNLGGRSPVFSS